jgi:hypothetical protein
MRFEAPSTVRVAIFAKVFAAVMLALSPAAVLAAKVSPTGGEVRVNSGHGFELITAPTEVGPGSQVMVSPKGSAIIAYADGCLVAAASSTVTVVDANPQCADFSEPMHFTPPVEEASDSRKRVRRAPKALKKKHHSVWDEQALIVGGLVLGGGIGAILALSGHDHGASP